MYDIDKTYTYSKKISGMRLRALMENVAPSMEKRHRIISYRLAPQSMMYPVRCVKLLEVIPAIYVRTALIPRETIDPVFLTDIIMA